MRTAENTDDKNDRETGLMIEALSAYGFDSRLLGDFMRLSEPGDMPARVTAVHRDRVDVVHPGVDSDMRGTAVHTKALVPVRGCPLGEPVPEQTGACAVGDWLVLRRSGDELIARRILPRRSGFVRKAAGIARCDGSSVQMMAANVDFCLIVTAAGEDFSLRRIERYIALTENAGVGSIVVITKTDLLEEAESLERAIAGAGICVPCASVCALEGRGLDKLGSLIPPASTLVMVGSSGAGKSTLLNALAGSRLAETGEIRLADQKGKHTTARRELFLLDSGIMVIDSPGMREVQLWADEAALDATFPEIEAHSALCRFRDCRHENEPGCAVRQAVEDGSLDSGRLASWRKLLKEVAHLDRRSDPLAAQAERQRWKNLNKDFRQRLKSRRGFG